MQIPLTVVSAQNISIEDFHILDDFLHLNRANEMRKLYIIDHLEDRMILL